MENKDHGSSSNQIVENDPPPSQTEITTPAEQHEAPPRARFNSEFLQNHQLPNETEDEMAARILEEIEEMTRSYDRLGDQIQRWRDLLDAEDEWLDNLSRELGDGAMDFGVHIDDGDENASQEGDVPEAYIVAGDTCCICLDPFEMSGEENKTIGCGHTFHHNCIGRWLLRKNSCPLCNRPVNLH